MLIIFYFPHQAPGAVGHLSFTEILDTSLKVSWSEPSEKNGILTGNHPNFVQELENKRKKKSFISDKALLNEANNKSQPWDGTMAALPHSLC